jgi:hypothetical protein
VGCWQGRDDGEKHDCSWGCSSTLFSLTLDRIKIERNLNGRESASGKGRYEVLLREVSSREAMAKSEAVSHELPKPADLADAAAAVGCLGFGRAPRNHLHARTSY